MHNTAQQLETSTSTSTLQNTCRTQSLVYLLLLQLPLEFHALCTLLLQLLGRACGALPLRHQTVRLLHQLTTHIQRKRRHIRHCSQYHFIITVQINDVIYVELSEVSSDWESLNVLNSHTRNT